MNLLMDHGHLHARHYPLGMLSDECRLVTRRVNAVLATEATLIQLAVTTVVSKKAGTLFRKTLKRLTED